MLRSSFQPGLFRSTVGPLRRHAALQSLRPMASRPSLAGKKYHARLFPEDKRYQDAYLQEMHKTAHKPELFDHYLTRVEDMVHRATRPDPEQSKGRGMAWLFTLSTIGLVYYLWRKMMQSMGGPPGMPGMSGKSHFKISEGGDTRFSDVHGIDEVKEELEIIVEFLNSPGKFREMGAKIPRGVLLYGPPGTGKTLLARAIAGEAKVPILSANASSFDEVFVGVGSRRIKDLFEAARKRAPCIIYVDELDAMASNRNNVMQNSNMAINQLLAELDGFEQTDGIVFIGSTNRLDSLDPAVIRPGRVDKLINVPLPDKKGRNTILEHYVAKVKCDAIDISKLAKITIGFSGAQLENLVNQAAILAVKQKEETVTEKHLQHAFSDVLMGIRRPLLLEGDEKKLVAFHESGHAIVSYFTPEARTIYQATILPRGSALGVVQTLGLREHSITRAQLLAQIDTAYGGRIAEEIIFGKDNVTTGCSSDFKQCYEIAKEIVINAGLSELGFIGLEKEHMGTDMQQRIDKEIEQILKESYLRTRALLMEHSRELHLLAETLLEEETLSGSEIEALLEGRVTPQSLKSLST